MAGSGRILFSRNGARQWWRHRPAAIKVLYVLIGLFLGLMLFSGPALAIAAFALLVLPPLAALAWIPSFGSRLLAWTGWTELPLVGRLSGFRASGTILAVAITLLLAVSPFAPQTVSQERNVPSLLPATRQAAPATGTAPPAPTSTSSPTRGTPLAAAAATLPSVVTPTPATTAHPAAVPTTPASTPQPTAPPTPLPTAQPTPAPTVTAAPAAAQHSVALTVTSPVRRGARASAIAQTTARSSCAITVTYASGPSRAQGLDPKTADDAGGVTWSWTVGTNTTLGSWPVDVRCTSPGGQSASARQFFVVQ